MDREDLRKATARLSQPADGRSAKASNLSSPSGARRSRDPRLDVDALQAVMEGDAAPGGDSRQERLEALLAWRDALVRRHVLARRLADTEDPTQLPLAAELPADPALGSARLLEEVGGASRAALDLRGLTRASNHARLDEYEPDFAHYGPLRRALARLLARAARFASRFITARQSVVNEILVEYVAESGDRLNEQQARIDRLTGSLQDVLERQRDETAFRLRELRGGWEALRAGIEETRAGLDLLRREGVEHELRLTDSECDRAWSRVAEVDQREELGRLRGLLESLGNRLEAQAQGLESLRRRVAAQEGVREVLEEVRGEQPALREKIAAQQDGLESIERRVSGHERDLESRDERASSQERAMAAFEQLVPRIGALEDGLAELDRASAELAAESARLRASGDGGAAGHLDSTLDGLYVNLENQFRGSRELVKGRLESYLPLLAETGAGSVDRPILDVGCGRGEWLELLSERGLLARGVEINSVAVSNCRSMGFDVTAGDALGYLRDQPANGLAMVTAFHVLEHLPFDYMVELLGETLRTLEPGGVALFETPNAENVAVSSRTFHFDPTHRRPLPPDLLVFLLRQHGFLGVRVERQTAGRPDERLAELDASEPLAERLNPVIGMLNRYFAAPSDFAVLGSKPR